MFGLSELKAQQAAIGACVQAKPTLARAVFFVAYVLMAALSLPGATVLTLAGGALFGLVTGTLLVSFASSIGATLAFLSARYLLRDGVRALRHATGSGRRRHRVAFEVTRYGIDDLDRAIADGTAHGWVKVLTPPGSDRILGVCIVGAHAGHVLAEFVLAMKHGLGLNAILATVHTYPTLAKANKYAAGAWRWAQVRPGQPVFLAALQAWRRGAGPLVDVLARVPGLLRRRPPRAE